MQRASLIFLGVALVAAGPARAQTAAGPSPAPASGYGGVAGAKSTDTTYVFGWGDVPVHSASPRGGNSTGGPVVLAPGRTLPLPEIASARDAFSRDRAAILALAGDFRVSFHEIESFGLTADYQPPRSYHSWATEKVSVIDDTGRRISLQHTLVMYFMKPDGTVSAPMLTKHWRQEWTYEDTDIHEWRGNDVWVRRRITPASTAGTWTHAVFNLEDSPRYEAPGRWEHRGNVSTWTSERAWRPLPRREYTVRSDYDVVEGTHSIGITPTGWVEERNMLKRATAGGKAVEPPRYVAQEIGIDRYERITSPSLSAADEYYRTTGPYWALVRKIWAEEIARRDGFTLRDEVDGKSSFQHHGEFIKRLESGEPFDAASAEPYIRRVITGFILDAREPVR